MKSNTLVTCVIPTVNRPDLLRRALNSVYKQTYENIEVVVVASPPHESTQTVLKEYKGFDRHLKPIYTDEKGMNLARNIGIENASGEYLALLDDDDVWRPQKIQKQLPYLRQYSIVSCLLISATKNSTYEVQPPVVKEIDINDIFYYLSVLDPAGTVYRTGELKEVGGFDEDIRFGEVWDVALKIMDRYDSCYLLDEALLVYDRKHDQKRFSNHPNHENLKQISEVFHRHKNKVRQEVVRKTWVKIKYAHYREMDDARRYIHFLSGLVNDYELELLKDRYRNYTRTRKPSISLSEFE